MGFQDLQQIASIIASICNTFCGDFRMRWTVLSIWDGQKQDRVVDKEVNWKYCIFSSCATKWNGP
ncbi:MAG: hypothetical protein R3274_03185, partial [Desulfobacterales bacterium]|nr:hypothetical protein [Desulfobacterales bacterium]